MQSSISNMRRGETTTWAQTTAMVDWLEAEGGRGIHTIEKKLENDCPFFSRLDVLYGERQNIMPTYHDIFDQPTQSFVSLLEKASSSQASDSTDSDLIQPLNDVNSSSSDLSSPSVKSMKRKGSPTLTDKIIEMMQQREKKENGKSQQAMIICELIKSLIKKLMII